MPYSNNSLDPLNFKAPKPTKTGWFWTKTIASRLIFPPILLWDLTKYAANKLIGEKIGGLVLPAQKMNFAEEQKTANTKITSINKKIYNENLTTIQSIVATHDGVHLDTLEISHQKNEDQKYIINFAGRAMCYEQLIDDMKEDASKLQCNVIGFNYRGVGLSTKKAKSKDDLVTDGIAQVERILSRGVDPESITLKGDGVATLVAKHFHEHGQKINLFNSRSFSTLTNTFVGRIRTSSSSRTGHSETFGKKILGWLANPFIKFGLSVSKWEIDAASAFKALPDSHKEYMVVRSPKADRKEHKDKLLDDPVIPHYASLHAALKNERRRTKANIAEEIDMLERNRYRLEKLNRGNSSALIQKNLEESKKHLTKAENALVEARNHLKVRKMIANSKSDNGHIISMDELTDRYQSNSATIFFQSFVKRAQTHHENERKSQLAHKR